MQTTPTTAEILAESDRRVAEMVAELSRLSPDELRARLVAFRSGSLQAVRQTEYESAVEAAGDNAFAAFWAGSAGASVERDVRAGRSVTVRLDTKGGAR